MTQQKERQLHFPDWFMPMVTAPKYDGHIDVLTKDGKIVDAHWACDLRGEEQLPFRGWFAYASPHSCYQIFPIGWRPLTNKQRS